MSKLIDIVCCIISAAAGLMIFDAFAHPLPPVQAGLYLIFAILVFCMALFIKHLQIQSRILKNLEQQKHDLR